jgi:hypothetical protein
MGHQKIRLFVLISKMYIFFLFIKYLKIYTYKLYTYLTYRECFTYDAEPIFWSIKHLCEREGILVVTQQPDRPPSLEGHCAAEAAFWAEQQQVAIPGWLR